MSERSKIHNSRAMPERLSPEELRIKADSIRKEVIEVSIKNGAGHIAPSLSCIDILVALYYRLMNLSDSPGWEERDRLVFSKSHGGYGLYAILADKGYIERKQWLDFYQGSCLMGCAERNVKIGIEAGCGSLGHGLPMAVGLAFGAKLQKKKYRIYCIVGDGEMQEGSNWEAAQFAVKHRLSNLTLFIDKNGLQAMDFLENILTVKSEKDDLKKKLEAFGLKVETCNGHDAEEIVSLVEKQLLASDQVSVPQAFIAKTVKGYGLRCMENVPKFHFRLPTEEELKMGNRYE